MQESFYVMRAFRKCYKIHIITKHRTSCSQYICGALWFSSFQTTVAFEEYYSLFELFSVLDGCTKPDRVANREASDTTRNQTTTTDFVVLREGRNRLLSAVARTMHVNYDYRKTASEPLYKNISETQEVLYIFQHHE